MNATEIGKIVLAVILFVTAVLSIVIKLVELILTYQKYKTETITTTNQHNGSIPFKIKFLRLVYKWYPRFTIWFSLFSILCLASLLGYFIYKNPQAPVSREDLAFAILIGANFFIGMNYTKFNTMIERQFRIERQIRKMNEQSSSIRQRIENRQRMRPRTFSVEKNGHKPEQLSAKPKTESPDLSHLGNGERDLAMPKGPKDSTEREQGSQRAADSNPGQTRI
jgi:hypothetical protein